MKTIRTFLNNRPDGLIYHYTDAAGAIGISRGAFWSSNIRHLNDSSEFLKARDLISGELRRVEKSGLAKSGLADGLLRASGIHDLAPKPSRRSVGRTLFSAFEQQSPLLFVVSFSEQENVLSQWRAYCPQGNGYALGFDASTFHSDEDSETRLVRCEYRAEEAQRLCRALIESWEAHQSENSLDGSLILKVFRECVTIMAAVKDPSFREEREWRLVSFIGTAAPTQYRQGRHGIVPYLVIPHGGERELKLKTVWLGPNSDQDAAEIALWSLLDDHAVTIRRSNIPYRR